MPVIMETATRTEDSFSVTDGWNRNGRPPSIAIVETIAAIDGTDPLDPNFFLNDFVDPDALDRLFFEQRGGEVVIDLRVKDFLVTVRADGGLLVRSPERQGTAAAGSGTATI